MTTRAKRTDALRNTVENLACRVARRNGGWLAPAQLLPYLPLSLGLVAECLDAMCDETSVRPEERDGLRGYSFSAYEGREPQAGSANPPDDCLCCGETVHGPGVLCPPCSRAVDSELNERGERTGWPAAALVEHEVFHIAAGTDGDVRPEDLAARSALTLGRMRRVLKRLHAEGYVRLDLDWATGLMVCRMPPMDYPEERYRAMTTAIRTLPATLKADMETRLARVFWTLAAMGLLVFVLALMHFPFPLLLLGFVVTASVATTLILRHKTAPAAA